MRFFNMKYLNLWISALLFGIFSLTGCENKAPKTETNNILSHQIEALDKAKALEQQLNDSADRQRKAIEDMTK